MTQCGTGETRRGFAMAGAPWENCSVSRPKTSQIGKQPFACTRGYSRGWHMLLKAQHSGAGFEIKLDDPEADLTQANRSGHKGPFSDMSSVRISMRKSSTTSSCWIKARQAQHQVCFPAVLSSWPYELRASRTCYWHVTSLVAFQAQSEEGSIHSRPCYFALARLS